jgi:two-component system, sensor histidine kinase PdtaS
MESIDPAVPQKPASRGALVQWAEFTLIKRSLSFEIGFAVLAFVTAAYLRFALAESLPPGFPFLTFFPAVLITSVFVSVRAGVAVAVASGFAAWYLFVTPLWSFALNADSATAMVFYCLIVGTELMLIAAMTQSLERLRLAEKRSSELAASRALMFAELQHRVSNNLATVAALLRLQAGRSSDPAARQTLSEAQVRIETISRLQRRLHSPNIQRVEVSDFIRDMADDTVSSVGAGKEVQLRFALQRVEVAHEKAVPLGLIVSELLMNAVEHSNAGGPGGVVITISLSCEPLGEEAGELVTLEVRDSGKGVPEGFDLATAKSLGISIARQFAAQLSGSLSLHNASAGGAISRLQFENRPDTAV